MHGLMMDFPLTIDALLRRARSVFAGRAIVGKDAEGAVHRTTWGEVAARADRLAGALRALGVGKGDRVATFAWNTPRHLELYFAVPCAGAVLHTLNVRLPAEQIAWIVRHAGDTVVFVDRALAATFAAVLPHLPRANELRCVVMDDHGRGADVRELPGAIDHEELLARAAPVASLPALDERDAAGLCYTSGTTGDPKGVLYSHRSTVLRCE